MMTYQVLIEAPCVNTKAINPVSVWADQFYSLSFEAFGKCNHFT